MYVRNSSKKRKYLIVKLFGTRSCDGSLYVCCCRYNGCINRRDVHITFFDGYFAGIPRCISRRASSWPSSSSWNRAPHRPHTRRPTPKPRHVLHEPGRDEGDQTSNKPTRLQKFDPSKHQPKRGPRDSCSRNG